MELLEDLFKNNVLLSKLLDAQQSANKDSGQAAGAPSEVIRSLKAPSKQKQRAPANPSANKKGKKVQQLEFYDFEAAAPVVSPPVSIPTSSAVFVTEVLGPPPSTLPAPSTVSDLNVNIEETVTSISPQIVYREEKEEQKPSKEISSTGTLMLSSMHDLIVAVALQNAKRLLFSVAKHDLASVKRLTHTGVSADSKVLPGFFPSQLGTEVCAIVEMKLDKVPSSWSALHIAGSNSCIAQKGICCCCVHKSTFAAWKGHEDIVEFLLNVGANPNVQNERGQSPLHVAALQGGLLLLTVSL